MGGAFGYNAAGYRAILATTPPEGVRDIVAFSWQLDVGFHTDTGQVREHNEDAVRVDAALGIFAVADGMGGHRAGERASFLAVQELQDYVQYRAESNIDEEVAAAAFRTANEAIFRESLENPSVRGMGTTMTAVLLRESDCIIGHVGDSRAWVVRRGVCRQLTLDHSVIGEQLREGLITEEQARTHPMRNVLTRSLGNLASVEVDVYIEPVLAGDTFVIGSDGMTRALDENGIAAHVAAAATAQDAAESMVQYACENDGTDNVSIVVVRCDPAD